MRYYSLRLSDPTTGTSIVPSGEGFTRSGTGPTFTSLYRDPLTGQVMADPALPTFKRQIFIDPRLVLNHDEAGWYATPSQWADYLLGVTQPLGAQLLGFAYPGVQISVSGDTIYVFDGTAGGPGSVLTQLNFEDLVGQPTWVSGTEVSVDTVLRADIGIANKVKFPAGIIPPYVITSPAAAVPGNLAPARSKSAFQGEFFVKEVHHWGNFRESDADSWKTVLRLVAPPVGSVS